MNMKKELLLALLATSATALVQGQTEAKAAPAAAIPAPAAVQAAGETDEVDLSAADDSAEAAKRKTSVKAVRPTPPTAEATAAADGKSAAKTTMEGFFDSGRLSDETSLVDIVCEDATLSDILRQFRKVTGANIISGSSSNLQQRVSMTLNHVPWLDALQTILNTRQFRLETRGGIYIVNEDRQLTPEFTRSYQLQHASAKELADYFNETLGGIFYDKKTGLPVPVAGKMPKPLARAFESANVVVVTASEKILSECEKTIKSVDKAIPQIYIEARFIEVSNEAMHKLGMQWNQLASWGATAKGLEAGWEYNNGRSAVVKSGKETLWYTPQMTTGSGASATTATTGKPEAYATQQNYLVPDGIGSAPGAGRSAADMAWRNARGFSGQLSADDFRIAMSAFESMSDAKIFSNPKIIVSNGKEAKVDMTTKFPHIKVTSQRTTSTEQSFIDMATEMQAIPGEDKLMFAKEAFFSWGITLDVKPRISSSGLISVEIVPTISQLDKDVTASGFYEVGSDSGTGLYPIIQVKRLTTDFTMQSGSTAVIGGLSKTTEEDIDSGIPYLRKIPWVGPKLFGWKSRGKVQKEIIVFVTLGIADPADLPADVGLPKNAVMGREYVEGRKLEPGDRDGGVANLMAFDLRPLEEQRRDDNLKPGSVTITPVTKQMPVAVPPPAPVVAPAPQAAPAPVEAPVEAKPAPATPLEKL